MAQPTTIFGPRWLLAALAGGACLGILAGANPLLALVAVAGIAYVILTMANVRIGLCVFTLIAFIDLLPVPLGPVVSLTKIAGLILAFGWLLSAGQRESSGRGLLDEHPGAIALIVGLLAWTTATSAWAVSPGAALGAAARYALDALLFVIALGILRKRRDMTWIVGAFIAGAALSAAYGIVVPSAASAAADPSRLAGTIGDPNQFAALLAAALPLAIALAAGREWPVQLRALGAVTAALSVTGILLSVSRGGLVALIVVLVAALLLAGRWRTKVLLVVPIVVLASTAYLIATPAALQRIQASNSGTGRTDLWTVGLRIVADRPILGVGAGNFPVATVHYLLRPGRLPRSDLIDNTPKVAHSTYLEVLADLGVVGALLFFGLVGLALTCGARAIRHFAQRRDEPMELLARAWLIGMAGMLAADAFLSAELDKQLWLLLAIGPALLAVARDPSRISEQRARLSPPSSRMAPGVVLT